MLKTEKCPICNEIVYVKNPDTGEEEWQPGGMCCTKLSAYFCATHKPCCASSLSETTCAGMDDDDEEDFDEDDDDDLDDYDEDYADEEDVDVSVEESNG